MTRAESALATAKRLAEVAAEDGRLSRVIATANDCPEVGDGFGASHLSAYLTAWKAEQSKMRWHHEQGEPDPGEWAAMRDCPICWAAYQAIQDRKDVRRRRGALRAALVRIGKLALEEATP